jgi:hypothetical protein
MSGPTLRRPLTKDGEDAMKRLLWYGVALAALLAAAPSYATVWPMLTADIPYEFAASGTKFPAGHYQIATDDENYGILELKNLDTNKTRLITFTTTTARTADVDSFLVFDEAGGQHVLSEIRLADRDGYWLPGVTGEHTHGRVKAATSKTGAPKK